MLETEIRVTREIAAEHGLSAGEYSRVLEILGREPSITELGIFSVMWSEHCSYKSSKVHLKRLPTRGPRVLQGPGENAGVVDIGDGLCAVFKIESHNHPSFVEPFQGAATGVGGILRDIFTMGAFPIAVLDSLRFGPITNDPNASAPLGATAEEVARNRRLFDGVVRGIGFYGNCFGVPTVGGEVRIRTLLFEESARECARARHREKRESFLRARARRREPRHLRRSKDRPRRNSWRVASRFGGIQRRIAAEAARTFRSATRSWRSCSWKRAWKR